MRAKGLAALLLITTLALSLSTPAQAFEPGAGCNTPTYPTELKYVGKILIPTAQDWETTPTVKIDGYWIPEESPTGTYPTGEWLDNSPVYTGWFLQVNDSNHTIQWLEMTTEHYELTHATPRGK